MKRFLWVTLLVGILLFLRIPHAFLHPALFAEDGNIFFKGQYEDGLAKTFFLNYQEYTHGAARLIAFACSWLPVAYIPLAYALCCLVISSMCFSVFSVSGFSPVIKNANIRILCCLLFCLMPNCESLMKVAYIDWYLLFAFMLCLLVKLEYEWLLLPFYLLVTWTSPVCVVLVPILIVRLFARPKSLDFVVNATTIASIAFYIIHADRTTGIGHVLMNNGSWLVSLLNALTYKVGLLFLGGDYLMGYNVVLPGWGIVTAIGLLSLGASVPLILQSLDEFTRHKARVTILIYLILSSSSVFILRQAEWPFYLNWNEMGTTWNGRHFYCGVLLLCVLLGKVLEHYDLLRDWKWRTVLCAWVCLHCLHFRAFEWHSPQEWPYYAKLIEAAKPGQEVFIETSPKHMSFNLRKK